MNSFYFWYSILMIVVESFFVWQAIKYSVFALHGGQRIDEAEGIEAIELAECKAHNAVIRAMSFIAMSFVGFYITVDCIVKAWWM